MRKEHGKDNWVERDLERYHRYLQKTQGRRFPKNEINYEEYLGFLDVEHFLGLKGKDNWSEEGNESQLMIRNGIAGVLYDRTPRDIADIPTEYIEFAKRLTTSDWILSFNYDTLLEQALDAVGLPYRLYPYRYSSIGITSNTVDNEKDELVLLKLHGSINWFNCAPYDRSVEMGKAHPTPYIPKHSVFGPDRVVEPTPLCDSPQSDEALKKLFVVKDIGPLLVKGFWNWSPMILAPSSAKLSYSAPLREFWWGAQRGGGLNLGFGVVGYSLPNHDEYARQVLYHLTRNYTGYEPNLELGGRRKSKIRILDLCRKAHDKKKLRNRYCFLDPKRSEFWTKGLDLKAIDWMFRD